MKVLIFGKNGQVGWELVRCFLPLGDLIALERSEADLSKPDELRSIVRKIKPDVIVNAAAYTAVDKAESDEELAMVVNGISPGILAEEARDLDALFVHYSTDYVFDGTKKGSYVEEDKPNPINVYGRSKLAGEKAISISGAEYLIFRTSWVYSARGHNFLNTMRRLASERDEIGIVSDQVGSPTWARFIAETTAHCVSKSMQKRKEGTFNSGLFHLTAKKNTSWYEFAKAIIKNVNRNATVNNKLMTNVKAIKTVDYPTPAGRPLNSCLSNEKIEQNFGVVVPTWDAALQLCMEE